MTQKASFDGGRELTEWRNGTISPVRQATFVQKIVDAVNRTAQNIGVSPVGESAAPPKIGSVNVKTSGEMVHVTLNDAQAIQRGIQYHIEYATNQEFVGSHVAHIGDSRGAFLNLPAKDDSGNPHSWYFRGYSQYHGSQPSEPVIFGGLSPTAVALTGSTQLTPLPSTGSGTATNAGTQGGWGLGKTVIRPAPGPKRSGG